MKTGFDNEKYLTMQSEHIRERISKFGNKLYLEFGGKLFDDFHASRVLPGFEPDSKLRMLMQLSDQDVYKRQGIGLLDCYLDKGIAFIILQHGIILWPVLLDQVTFQYLSLIHISVPHSRLFPPMLLLLTKRA